MVEFFDEPYVPKKSIGDRLRKPLGTHKVQPADYGWQGRARLIDPVPFGEYFLPQYVAAQIGYATKTFRNKISSGEIPEPNFKNRQGWALFSKHQLRLLIRIVGQARAGKITWKTATQQLVINWQQTS